jgi:hypothetical protein
MSKGNMLFAVMLYSVVSPQKLELNSLSCGRNQMRNTAAVKSLTKSNHRISFSIRQIW